MLDLCSLNGAGLQSLDTHEHSFGVFSCGRLSSLFHRLQIHVIEQWRRKLFSINEFIWWWLYTVNYAHYNVSHLQKNATIASSTFVGCPGQSFLSLCHQRRVAGLSMLYKVNANSNYCLFGELPSASSRVRNTGAAVAAHLLKFEVPIGVEPPILQGVPCLSWFECGMTFHTLSLTPERWIGSRVQSTVGCFPALCVLQFSWAQVLMRLRKLFINDFVFPTWVCSAAFNNNNNSCFTDADPCTGAVSSGSLFLSGSVVLTGSSQSFK